MTVAVVTAVAGLAVLLVAVLAVLGFPKVEHTPTLPLAQLLNVLKLVLGTVAGVGALFALVMAYRRQRLAEVADDRDQQRARDDLTRVFNERFNAAAEQLGHAEPAVRLAGAHAMAGLADDWEHGRQTCIDVLCAYLQLPYEPDSGEDSAADQRLAFARNQRVRHTIIDIITAHLRQDARVSWQGHDFDFSGVVFDGGNFYRARFTGGTVNFYRARFVGGTVFFYRVQFTGGRITFDSARFAGGTVSFHDAQFAGGRITFYDAQFTGGQVDFSQAAVWAAPPDFGGLDLAAPPTGLRLPAATA